MPNYSPPTNPVGTYNPCYMTNLYGAPWSEAWNTSIYGSPTQAGANVLSNCVGWCQGRMLAVYREITGYNPTQTQTHPFIMFNVDAGNWDSVARANGFEVVNEPRAGSVLVTNSHVAFVEDFIAGEWWVSESGYGNPDPWHYWPGTLVYRNNRWESTFSYDGDVPDPVIKGFILVPGVTPGPGPGPGPTPRRKSKFIYYLKNWNNDIY